MTQWDLQTEDFEFEDPSCVNSALSFLTESSTSCPSSVASSRRSSEISFAGSSSGFSSFTPTSPISAAPCFEHLALNSNPTADFSSARLQYFVNEVASLELSEPVQPDQCMIPAATSYASLNIDGNTVPCGYSESVLAFYQDEATDARILGADLPMDGGSEQLISYPNDIDAAIPDESMVPFLHPPFIIPSQTLKNHDSQGVSITNPSPANSPEDLRNPIFGSRYDTESAVVSAAYKSSNRILRSETVRPRSSHRSHRMRNHLAGGKCLEHNIDTEVTVRMLKPTKATRFKKFKCLLCEQGFDRQEHYKRHQNSERHQKLIENFEKPVKELPVKMFPCRACGKTFNRHDNLKPHIRTHFSSEMKSSRNKPVTIQQSWQYGWEELDPRISNDEVARGRRERSRRVARG